MKPIIRKVILITAAFLFSTMASCRSQDPQADAELIRETERARIKALVDGKIDIARQFHADDFQLINPLGRLLTTDKYWEGLVSGKADYLIWEPGTIEVRMYGNAAVIRYQSKIHVAAKGREDMGLRPHWHTDLYEKRNGRWQIVWSHANIIDEAWISR